MTSQIDYYQFIENVLGISLDANMNDALPPLTRGKVMELYDAYFELPLQRQCFIRERSSKTHIYRPLIDENFLEYTSREGGYFPFGKCIHGQLSFGQLADLLYSITMFGDGVVVRDPLYILLVWFQSPEGRYPNAIPNVTAFLNWLRSVRPLYDARRLDFYSIGPALQFRHGPRLNQKKHRYGKFEEQWDEPNMAINSYLRKIDEMNFLASNLDADFFLDSDDALAAYQYWMSVNDNVVHRSCTRFLENANLTLRLGLPIYSSDCSRHFVSVLSNEEAIDELRTFLSGAFAEIANINEISDRALASDILSQAQDRIRDYEFAISRTALKERKTRFWLYKLLGSPVGTVIDVGERIIERNERRKAVGLVRDLLQ